MSRPIGHVEQVAKHRWRLWVELPPDPLDRKRRRVTRTVTATSKRDAEHQLALLIAEAGAGRHEKATASRTVNQLLDAWLVHAQPRMQSTTLASFESAIRLYVRPHIGDLPLVKVDAWAIDSLYAMLLSSGGAGGRPLAPATVGKAHAALRLAFAQAVRWHWAPSNPVVNATAPAVPRTSVRPPSDDEARQLIDVADELDPEWATYLRLAAATGLRRGELCALRWSAVDIGRAEITVSRSVILAGGGREVRDYPKTAAGRRRLAIGEATVALLVSQRERQRARGLLVADPYVFSPDADGGRPWHPTVVTHRFGRLRKRAGVQGVTLHGLRHFLATQLLGAGVDVRTVAGRMGHANPAITLSTYAAFIPANDQAAAGLIDGILDQPARP